MRLFPSVRTASTTALMLLIASRGGPPSAEAAHGAGTLAIGVQGPLSRAQKTLSERTPASTGAPSPLDSLLPSLLDPPEPEPPAPPRAPAPTCYDFSRDVRIPDDVLEGPGSRMSTPDDEDYIGEGDSPFIRLLELDPVYKRLYALSAGVSEGYTVRQHTGKVLEIFESQVRYFALDKLASFPGAAKSPPEARRQRVTSLMRLTMALHDIGKGVGVLETGDTRSQHDYTVPFLVKKLREKGFDEAEVRVARALVDNDIIGEYLKGWIDTAESAFLMLHRKALEAGMDDREFFQLQWLFYDSDAGAYPFLLRLVFGRAPNDFQGKMTPTNPKFAVLREMYEQPIGIGELMRKMGDSPGRRQAPQRTDD